MRTRPTSVTSRITGASFGEDATLLRRAPGSRDEFGEWIEGELVETAIRVSRQPPPGKDRWSFRERLVEESGIRLSGAVVLYSTIALRPAGDGTVGDIVVAGGVRHRVMAVEDWGSLTAALAERIEPQSGG